MTYQLHHLVAGNYDLILVTAVKIAELRQQLASAPDDLVETVIDARYLHARMEGLQAELVEACAERDAWWVAVEQARRAG